MGAPAISARGAAAPAPARRPRRAAPAKPRARANAPARRVSTPSKAMRKAPARASRATATKPRPKASAATARRTRITPPGGVAMLPVAAVAGTAGAVGGIANSGLVVGLSRGRAWIAVLGLLLGGIVALNVWGLSLSASTSSMAMEIDELQRTNSVLETRIAQRLSSERIQSAAAAVGLNAPAADAVRYVEATPSDAQNAAKRIGAGEISVLSALPIAPELAEAAAVPVVEEAATIDPATGLPIDPATGLPIDPATGLPADPAATTAPAPEDPAATAPAPVAAEPATTEPTAAAPADQATAGAIGAP
jgi:hypothetical protein